ncbi:MAG TPA: sulfotransferase [Rudaea sp.]|nr:sulfotransferase [Rudaea sp.]
MRNLFVTGIPRSGTTLVAALIDSLDDAVCLSEPEWQDAWPREMTDPAAYAQRLCADFDRVRNVLRSGASVTDRRKPDGAAISDYFPREAGNRTQVSKPVVFRRDSLSAEFLLGMKQNAHFTCILDRLVERDDFAVLAIVRNPVATLSSWRSLDLPISQGRLPAAERFWPQVADVARTVDDILLRQVLIYGLFCARYHALREKLTILRHEDIVANPTLICDFSGRTFVREVALQPGKAARSSDAALHQRICECIRVHCPVVFEFYPELIEAGAKI